MSAVTIYQSDPGPAIEALAQLDSAACPAGPVLVAAVDGAPRAAVPLAGGRAIADPFHATAELVSMLELRVAQLNGNTATRQAGLALRARLGRAGSQNRRPWTSTSRPTTT